MKFWNGCRKAVYAALFVLLILMSAYIFYGALDTLEHAEAFQAILQGKKVPLFLAGTSFLLCVFLAALSGRLAPYLERHERIVVPALFCMMAALQVTLVLTVRTSLRYDHLKIFDTAAALLEQETIADTHFRYYFMKYPNNIPVCLFTAAWLRVAQLFGLPRAAWMDYMKLVNLLFMNAGLYCTFRLIARHRSRRSGLIFLLLLLVNPLWYLLGQMYYTSTISLAFSMGAVWLFDQAGRQKEPWKRYLLYAVMGMALAFGYRIRAFEALDSGDAAGYARLLRRGLNTAKDMKPMVEFLTEHTPELQSPSQELLELADKVRGMLAAFDPGDPAVAAIRQSPVYQKVAYLIEGVEAPVIGGLAQ